MQIDNMNISVTVYKVQCNAWKKLTSVINWKSYGELGLDKEQI